MPLLESNDHPLPCYWVIFCWLLLPAAASVPIPGGCPQFPKACLSNPFLGMAFACNPQTSPSCYLLLHGKVSIYCGDTWSLAICLVWPLCEKVRLLLVSQPFLTVSGRSLYGLENQRESPWCCSTWCSSGWGPCLVVTAKMLVPGEAALLTEWAWVTFVPA